MSKYNWFFISVFIAKAICVPKLLATYAKPEVEVFENTSKTLDFAPEAVMLFEQIRNLQVLKDKIKIALTQIDKKTDKEDMINEMVVLTESIYELLLCGQTPDEITAMFADNKQHVSTIRKFAVHMAALQNKQTSKGVPINIIINNEEKEKYYANKNFWATIENVCFALEIIVIVVIIIMLYRYSNLEKILKYIECISKYITYISSQNYSYL